MFERLRYRLRSVEQRGQYHLSQSGVVRRVMPFRKPPVLLLSYPRSGSSWAGKILGTSPNAVYLREPVTQPYLKKGGLTITDVEHNRQALHAYVKLADKAFEGIPPDHPSVVGDWHDFSLIGRSRKMLLIKEVNPKALHFYHKRYKPRILLLLRHPAAIALSFRRLGWLESADVQIETGKRAANAWERFGYTYGILMKESLDIAREIDGHKILFYEDLANDPVNRFKQIMEFLDFKIPENYDNIIKRYCYSKQEIGSAYQIQRMSGEMIDKWRRELSGEEIQWLKEGFLQAGLSYYSHEEDWEPDR